MLLGHFTKNAFNTGDHEMEKAGSHDSFVLLLTLLVNETLKKSNEAKQSRHPLGACLH